MKLANAISTVTMDVVETVLEYSHVINIEIFNAIIELKTLEGFHTFENERAESDFYHLVKKRVSSEYPRVYEMVYPRMQMDANGRYTTDNNKWA